MHIRKLLIRVRHRIPAWLALFAMLMVVIAPVISQSLGIARAHSVDIVALSDYCGQVPGGLPAVGEQSAGAHEQQLDASASGAASDSDPQTMLHERCGYCSLVHDLPMLAGQPGTVLEIAAPPAKALLEYSGACVAAKPFFPRALTRAPPVAL